MWRKDFFRLTEKISFPPWFWLRVLILILLLWSVYEHAIGWVLPSFVSQ